MVFPLIGMDPYAIAGQMSMLEDRLGRVAVALERITSSGSEGMDKLRDQARSVGDEMESSARRGEAAFSLAAATTEQRWKRVWSHMGAKSGGDMAKQFGLAFVGSPSNFRMGQRHLPGARVGGALRGAAASLPFGRALASPMGIIGGMIAANFTGQKYTAQGQQVMQQLEQAGAVRGSGGMGGVGGRIASLSATLGRDVMGDMSAGAGAFGGSGFGQNDVMQKMGMVKGLKSNAIEAAMGLDFAFEAAAGTSAKFAAQLATDTNSTLKESVGLVGSLGAASRESGMSFTGFMGHILQATSAMRLFNMSGEGTVAVSDAFLKMQGGFMGEGMNKQRAGTMAGRGIAGLAGLLGGGLSEGMMGFVGQQVGQSRGMDLSGVGAIIEMQRGFRGDKGGKGFVGDAIGVMSEMMKAQGPDLRDQEFFAQKVFGMSPEVSQAFMAMHKDQKEGTNTAKSQKKHAAEIEKALQKQAAQTPEYIRLIKELKLALLKTIIGTSGAIVTGIYSLYLLLKGLFQKALGYGDDAENTFGRLAGLQPIVEGSINLALSGFEGAYNVAPKLLASLFKSQAPPAAPGGGRDRDQGGAAAQDILAKQLAEYEDETGRTIDPKVKERIYRSMSDEVRGDKSDLRSYRTAARYAVRDDPQLTRWMYDEERYNDWEEVIAERRVLKRGKKPKATPEGTSRATPGAKK